MTRLFVDCEACEPLPFVSDLCEKIRIKWENVPIQLNHYSLVRSAFCSRIKNSFKFGMTYFNAQVALSSPSVSRWLQSIRRSDEINRHFGYDIKNISVEQQDTYDNPDNELLDVRIKVYDTSIVLYVSLDESSLNGLKTMTKMKESSIDHFDSIIDTSGNISDQESQYRHNQSPLGNASFRFGGLSEDGAFEFLFISV